MVKVVKNNVDQKSECIYTYRFLHSGLNPSWSLDKLISVGNSGILLANPLRSCLRRDNSDRIVFGDLITPIPKRLTTLEVTRENPDTGEISHYEHYTDDFKFQKNRQRTAVKKFCDFYEPLYRKKEVSVLFHTFTRWDYSKRNISMMLDAAKVRYKALKRPIRGWLWVLELKKNDGMDTGYHIHYHLVVAIDRLNIRGKEMPAELKFEELWGQRTDVEFVKYSVRRYLTKELGKGSDAKLINRRSYSISRKLI